MQFIRKLTKLKNKIRKARSRGVTPIIATVLILGLVIAGVVIGFVQILPYIEESSSTFDANVYDHWGWLALFEELFPNEIEKYEIFSELNKVLDKHFPLHIYYEVLRTFHKKFNTNLIELPKLRILNENLICWLNPNQSL